MSNSEDVQVLPLLPLKNSVLFPNLLMPLSVGRPSSRAAVEAVLATEGKEMVIVAQRDSSKEEPQFEDLYNIGTRAIIKKMARQSENHMELIVLGVERVVILRLEQSQPYLTARVRPYPLPDEKTPEVQALHRAVIELAGRAIQLAQPSLPVEVSQFLSSTDDPVRLAYLLGSMMSLELSKEQALLEAATPGEALRMMHKFLTNEIQVLELRNKIASEAQSEMTKQQREYFLRQQLRAIQQELGEKDPQQAEVEMLRERLEKLQLPEEVAKEAQRELSRLERLPPGAPDYQVIRTYLDYVVELPWNTTTEDNLDLARARQVLDEDHFDLKEVKERILEHLGVLKLNPEAKAPILCFFGPPGVGKTSLGQSIARALGRKFERMSLGGLHDEAELRGHRRTYIGAMPGRIIQAIRRGGSKNPVLMLDEVDKLGRDFRGDPAAALLEILDPEQNKSFRDNYLDLPFDLSQVFFITTANTLDTIPRPLLDRMEVLRLPGYSEEEKIQIANRYLIPRQLKEAGLTPEQCSFSDDTLRTIISRYTREAGLRQLERNIGRVARKVALRYAEGKTEPVAVRPDDLPEMLGPYVFSKEELRKELPPGVATGLAWTETGGDVLYVEATLLPGGKGLTITGQLGEVMQESARAAQSYIWSHAEEFGIDAAVFKDSGLHIHVPAGAIPKDGPSAGITMATAMASLYMQAPARPDTAMTGEITLTGLVLPVGGIKEKVLAARRAGVTRIILPRANEKDLPDLPDEVRRDIEFIFAERIEDVLAAAVPALAEKAQALKTG
ncbi:MAG TPA: endopeptidase La [Bryobacteraceae bacterium]|mgnify:CR=1 FL=1|nr:endopeptidase La [Bryobacteraceae bacterium]HPU72723.1 endopeptidase La [Bryobacteraceae bacterium]